MTARFLEWARRQQLLRNGYKGISFRTRRLARSLGGDPDPLTIELPRRLLSDRGCHVFCGYYDTSPFDARESWLRASTVTLPSCAIAFSPRESAPTSCTRFR